MKRQRSDANQAELVKRYRQHGCSVLVLSQFASVDLLVGCRGQEQLVEVKDGAKPKSKRGLTKDEQDFHDAWRGRSILIIENVDDVDEHVATLQREAGFELAPARFALDNCS